MRTISRDLREKLNYVKIGSEDVDLCQFPDFFIVGPQRTGTTWLYKNLKRHPQVFFPIRKELHFFNKLKSQDHHRFQSEDLCWYLDFFKPERISGKKLRILEKYGLERTSMVHGEATASYATLNSEIVSEITALRPDIKIILLVRNPVDRAWSHAKRNLAQLKKREVAEIPESEFMTFFNLPYQLKCARYTAHIHTWSDYLLPGNLFVGFFDEILSNPEKLLCSIFTFLGIESSASFLGKKVHEVVNSGRTAPIPRHFELYLQELFQSELQELEKRYGLVWP